MTEIEEHVIREDLEGDVPRGFYRRSNGDLTAISDMLIYHLKAAHAKTLRDEPYRIGELADMASEIAKRDLEYTLAQAEEQAK